ncbi:uncharacterized protein NPIL_462011 [Nephila pilipes]|uniref:Uncharacterized protein n=1 Tax=Nephila pilipes TaxID=299642 RepID=A0A8X6Q6D3_NEPPI|nr:uncharacterized protein NPIL_462011 [Nephila pilipes]
MGVSFWPSLELIAYARLARGILYTFDFETLKCNFKIDGIISDDYIKRIKDKISTCKIPAFETILTRFALEPINITNQQIYLPLPKKIQEKLVRIVLALVTEVKLWFDCHTDTNLYKLNFDVWNTLSWLSSGIIDRLETARILIRDENVDVGERFYFACKYYFEEDAHALWKKYPETKDILEFMCIWTDSARYWKNALMGGTALNWEQISLSNKTFFIRNLMGIRCCFTRLQGLEIKFECIESGLISGWMHHCDLYYCLSQMNVDELRFVFRRLSQYQLCKMFKCFRLWPFQLMFLDILNSFKTYITDDILHDLISFLKKKEKEPHQDYAYADILRLLESTDFTVC